MQFEISGHTVEVVTLREFEIMGFMDCDKCYPKITGADAIPQPSTIISMSPHGGMIYIDQPDARVALVASKMKDFIACLEFAIAHPDRKIVMSTK